MSATVNSFELVVNDVHYYNEITASNIKSNVAVRTT